MSPDLARAYLHHDDVIGVQLHSPREELPREGQSALGGFEHAPRLPDVLALGACFQGPLLKKTVPGARTADAHGTQHVARSIEMP